MSCERDVTIEELAVRAFVSYCSGCKKMQPIAPGLGLLSWIVVSHVMVPPGGIGVKCRPQRTFTRDEQRRNWDDDGMWDL